MNESNSDRPVLVTGGRGFVGTALVQHLVQRGEKVVVLSRESGGEHCGAPVISYAELAQVGAARGCVNLAGANIAGGRWSSARKQELRGSRLTVTQQISEWAQGLSQPLEFLINASAIGYYGETGEAVVTESSPCGAGFAAELCRDWEAAIDLPPATRSVIFRIGVVLGARGGALQRMLPPFKFGLGGPIGNGQQWMAWIALDDLIDLMLAAMEDVSMQGVYNAVAPNPVRNGEFARSLGRVLHRPAVLPVPAFLLKMLLGEMSELLLGSQRVVSDRLSSTAFQFSYPRVDKALARAVAGQV